MRNFSPVYGMLGGMESREAVATGARSSDAVERARAGDRVAFEELMEEHLPRVWSVVWRILRHREDTEDVVQEVFLAAHQALSDYRGEALFSTWLHRIAVNRALNHRRLAAERLRRASLPLSGPTGSPDPAPEARLAAPPGTSSPLRALESAELRRRLAECLEKLPPIWRAAIALRDGESHSYQEIAAILGTALGTVRSRLARARLALRRCVEEGR
jgi:RNA polymerase sigma-70 factor (ECF subfamily)